MEGSVTKPAKELVTKPSRRQLPERMEFSPLEAVHFLIRLPGHGAVSFVVRLHMTRNQGFGGGGGLLFSLSQSLAEFLLPIPASLSSAALEILVPRGDVLPARGTIIVPLNWKIRLELTPCVSVCMLSRVQLCATPWTMDHSPTGSSLQGIFQTTILERVAISCSRGSS